MTPLRAALLATALTLALLPLSAAPGAAQGLSGTILYVQGGQVVASAPDGSASHVVTSGGGDWSSPSMADDGTIVAVRNDSEIVRLTQSGEILSAFVPARNLNRIASAEVSPDGEYVAFASVIFCTTGDGRIEVCSNVEIVHADGRSPDSIGSDASSRSTALTFFPDRPTVAFGGVHTVSVGDDSGARWFSTFIDVSDLSLSRDGRLLAIAGCDYGVDDLGLSCAPSVQFFSVGGPPPTQPTQHDCFILNSDEVVSYQSASLSPDGRGVVFEEVPEDAETGKLTVLTGFSADPCGIEDEIVLLESGGSDVFWGAAPYDPTGGPGGPGEPGEPDEVVRVDGGGSADPIGQAVATSRALFDDGTADRVVLATADRFPDALAGAALAGTRGPILLTPTAGDLDPRVAAEIARVTGGDGTVLVLGGDAAVNEAAAGQARAAAGDRPCAAPLPTTCRYAGIGREHTAALIAETVLAENPGTSRALLARGDAFADAITGGAYAAAAGVPILLTPSTELNSHTEAFLETHPMVTEVVILGGEAAVGQVVAASLPAVTVRRVEGAERTATSAAIATELWQPEGLAGGGVVVVNVRHDDGWQTALAAAVASAALGAPQLGVETPPAAPTDAVLAAAATLGTGQVIVFGGPDLVSDDQAQAVHTAGG